MIYLLIINIITFFLYGFDKKLSVKHRFRIAEFNLFFAGLLGGCLGGLIGMNVFHHKTKKKRFWILNILFLIIWIIMGVIYYGI